MAIPWLPEEEKILSEIVDAGGGIDDVLSILKSRGEASVRNKMQALKLKFKRETAEIDFDAFKTVMAALKGGS